MSALGERESGTMDRIDKGVTPKICPLFNLNFRWVGGCGSDVWPEKTQVGVCEGSPQARPDMEVTTFCLQKKLVDFCFIEFD